MQGELNTASQAKKRSRKAAKRKGKQPAGVAVDAAAAVDAGAAVQLAPDESGGAAAAVDAGAAVQLGLSSDHGGSSTLPAQHASASVRSSSAGSAGAALTGAAYPPSVAGMDCPSSSSSSSHLISSSVTDARSESCPATASPHTPEQPDARPSRADSERTIPVNEPPTPMCSAGPVSDVAGAKSSSTRSCSSADQDLECQGGRDQDDQVRDCAAPAPSDRPADAGPPLQMFWMEELTAGEKLTLWMMSSIECMRMESLRD